MDNPEICRWWTKLAYKEGPSKVSMAENIFRWARKEPLAYLELKFRMFLLFWNKDEIPNNVAISANGKKIKSHLIHSPFLLNFHLVGTLGVAGMILALLNYSINRKVIICCTIIGTYCLGTVLFYILSRFRLPIVPLICGFAGFALTFYWRSFKRLFFRIPKA